MSIDKLKLRLLKDIKLSQKREVASFEKLQAVIPLLTSTEVALSEHTKKCVNTFASTSFRRYEKTRRNLEAALLKLWILQQKQVGTGTDE